MKEEDDLFNNLCDQKDKDIQTQYFLEESKSTSSNNKVYYVTMKSVKVNEGREEELLILSKIYSSNTGTGISGRMDGRSNSIRKNRAYNSGLYERELTVIEEGNSSIFPDERSQTILNDNKQVHYKVLLIEEASSNISVMKEQLQNVIKTKFIITISHELNNPLNGLLHSIDSLLPQLNPENNIFTNQKPGNSSNNLPVPGINSNVVSVNNLSHVSPKAGVMTKMEGEKLKFFSNYIAFFLNVLTINLKIRLNEKLNFEPSLFSFGETIETIYLGFKRVFKQRKINPKMEDIKALSHCNIEQDNTAFKLLLKAIFVFISNVSPKKSTVRISCSNNPNEESHEAANHTILDHDHRLDTMSSRVSILNTSGKRARVSSIIKFDIQHSSTETGFSSSWNSGFEDKLSISTSVATGELLEDFIISYSKIQGIKFNVLKQDNQLKYLTLEMNTITGGDLNNIFASDISNYDHLSLKRYKKDRRSSLKLGEFGYKVVINEKSLNGSDKSLQNRLSSQRLEYGKEYKELKEGKESQKNKQEYKDLNKEKEISNTYGEDTVKSNLFMKKKSSINLKSNFQYTAPRVNSNDESKLANPSNNLLMLPKASLNTFGSSKAIENSKQNIVIRNKDKEEDKKAPMNSNDLPYTASNNNSVFTLGYKDSKNFESDKETQTLNILNEDSPIQQIKNSLSQQNPSAKERKEPNKSKFFININMPKHKKSSSFLLLSKGGKKGSSYQINTISERVESPKSSKLALPIVEDQEIPSPSCGYSHVDEFTEEEARENHYSKMETYSNCYCENEKGNMERLNSNKGGDMPSEDEKTKRCLTMNLPNEILLFNKDKDLLSKFDSPSLSPSNNKRRTSISKTMINEEKEKYVGRALTFKGQSKGSNQMLFIDDGIVLEKPISKQKKFSNNKTLVFLNKNKNFSSKSIHNTDNLSQARVLENDYSSFDNNKATNQNNNIKEKDKKIIDNQNSSNSESYEYAKKKSNVSITGNLYPQKPLLKLKADYESNSNNNTGEQLKIHKSHVPVKKKSIHFNVGKSRERHSIQEHLKPQTPKVPVDIVFDTKSCNTPRKYSIHSKSPFKKTYFKEEASTLNVKSHPSKNNSENMNSNKSLIIARKGTEVVDRTYLNDSIDTMNILENNEIKRKHFCSQTDILVVDDESINRKTLLNLLSKQNIKADEAVNGIESVQMVLDKEICENCSPYKLIFMDIMMPEMDGITASRELSTKFDNPKYLNIIIVSAHDSEQVREMIQKIPLITTFISKPINKVKMKEVITEFYLKPKLED
eukprot:CAMPEP_0170537868 /NCGR_PEP_ID=MMETSP0209-20121228/102974_1 /TAXON_ID=665100 ORGANISM="Litonotus pictus, Strain P1" /NCGR_SAMPLE_ID=MMETSP0209 /ASSEMBLY_ACC=CAM_ASM_000301 /LENGTH=1280 /DNA_ID=CAMNT_0010839455 /DNA_START=964 /DNA_END=4806 /DNA_ORIENTATION=-